MVDVTEPPAGAQVLVAGGGPAGLSAALELAEHDIDTVVVEPRTYVSHTNPRAKLTNVRTMEHFRRWGVADSVREAANLPPAWSDEVVFCRHLLGDEIARFADVFGTDPSPRRYAEGPQQVPQFFVEDALREAVRERPSCSLVTGWRVAGLEQDDDGVTATVENCIERATVPEGERRELRANYLLGCDGARSTVRSEIGSSYEGEVRERNNLGVVFRAPHLADRHEHGPAVHYWTITEEIQGFMGRLDLDDTWWFIAVGVEDEDPDPETLVRTAIGDDADVRILTTDPWSPRMLLVDEARDRRVFLVGDAAHLNPPWGGHGYNTGVGDAVDIGWKLAAVVNGWGGDDLLDTYERERRAVHEEVIRVSTENMDWSPADLAELLPDEDSENGYAETARRIYETKKLEFHSLGMVLGYRYDGSPIVHDEAAEPPESSVTEYVPTSYPGSRLPHGWLDEAAGESIYDALGPEFTLLRLDSSLDAGPFRAAAERLGVPLSTLDVNPQRLTHEYEKPLLLVRPDQHVAWRGDSLPADPEAVLERVCGR